MTLVVRFSPHFEDSRLCCCVDCGTVFLVRKSEVVGRAEDRYFDCPECDWGVWLEASYKLVRENR